MKSGKPFFDADAHLNEEGVALFVDALKLDRTGDLPREVREHVAGCQTCKKEVTGLFSLLGDEDYGNIREHPYFDHEGQRLNKLSTYIVRIAAIVVAAIGVVVLAQFIGSPGRQDPGSLKENKSKTFASDTSGVDTLRKKEEHAHLLQVYADNFATLPELDYLIDNEVRSAGVEVSSPKNGLVVGRKILFAWAGHDKGALHISLANNKGRVIYSAEVLGHGLVVDSALAPGLYYWKLNSQEELLHVGKFLVK